MISTVSLQTAKKLKEAGFKKETFFYWVWFQGQGWEIHSQDVDSSITDDDYHDKEHKNILAPTSDEMLEELPWRINFENWPYDLMITKGPKNYSVRYVSTSYMPKRGKGGTKMSVVNENLCEALATVYEWLSKENLLKRGG